MLRTSLVAGATAFAVAGDGRGALLLGVAGAVGGPCGRSPRRA